jgi:hypothetical protein
MTVIDYTPVDVALLVASIVVVCACNIPSYFDSNFGFTEGAVTNGLLVIPPELLRGSNFLPLTVSIEALLLIRLLTSLSGFGTDCLFAEDSGMFKGAMDFICETDPSCDLFSDLDGGRLNKDDIVLVVTAAAPTTFLTSDSSELNLNPKLFVETPSGMPSFASDVLANLLIIELAMGDGIVFSATTG